MPYWRLYYHMVWTTKNRHPLITSELEPFLHSALAAKVESVGGRIYAINGMEDHIHIVASVKPSISVAEMIQIVKGSTSHLINHKRNIPFKWQEGYGIFTVSPRGLQSAMEYVRNQKRHHHEGTLIDALEYSTEREDGLRR